MVEGHSVHRVATLHRQRLVGNAFRATSPNGRFTQGAQAIDGKLFYRIEAVGKNLFAFFREAKNSKQNEKDDVSVVVVHVHFGMAGNWAVYENVDPEEIPDPTPTNRLRLQHPTLPLTADLSAMTVKHGTLSLYEAKRAQLGQDPLRDDANPDLLWKKVQASKKSIGALIMDQCYFTGPGNIYRAEILFKAGVHPDIPGRSLTRQEFDQVWFHTVTLLQRGYQTGSILTVDPDEARRLGKPKLRRYIYNTSHCSRCNTQIQVWQIANRTCYACPSCQPKRASVSGDDKGEGAKQGEKTQRPCIPFNSHCAPESAENRLRETGPSRLTVAEIKSKLVELGLGRIPKGLRKAGLVELLIEKQHEKQTAEDTRSSTCSNVLGKPGSTSTTNTTHGVSQIPLDYIVSSEAAAAEKAVAKESLAVEHIAELAPGQARKARSRATQTSTAAKPPPTPKAIRKRKLKAGKGNIVTPSPKKKRLLPSKKP